jgi:hypothetical protein
MNLLDELRKIKPDFKEFIQQEILDTRNNLVGSRCYGINNSGDSFSGGTSSSKETALRIAIAEAFERSLFYKICENEMTKVEFEINNFPSTSGFAAGYDENPTRFRAICEGVERWAWSKWIDDNFILDPYYEVPKLSPLSLHLLSDFKDHLWFKKEISIEGFKNEIFNLSIVIFLGITDQGIFPGSRVSTIADELYEHPIIEAHRNLINFQLNQESQNAPHDIIEQRTYYFGSNKDIAFNQIKKAHKQDWPQPEILLLKKFDTNIPSVFLYRCLLKDFIGWHEGPKDRFVY